MPNGAQKSSWTKPPKPFSLIAKKIISTQTDSASAKVVLTSAVGTMRKPCSVCGKSPRTHVTESTGRKSMAFISSTQTNTVNASGATNLLRSPWKMPFTWPIDVGEADLDERLRLARHARSSRSGDPPEEARGRRIPRMIETMIESTLSVQKPPSPMGCVEGREVVRDVLGRIFVLRPCEFVTRPRQAGSYCFHRCPARRWPRRTPLP